MCMWGEGRGRGDPKLPVGEVGGGGGGYMWEIIGAYTAYMTCLH